MTPTQINLPNGNTKYQDPNDHDTYVITDQNGSIRTTHSNEVYYNHRHLVEIVDMVERSDDRKGRIDAEWKAHDNTWGLTEQGSGIPCFPVLIGLLALIGLGLTVLPHLG